MDTIVLESNWRALLKVQARDPGFEWPEQGDDVLGGLPAWDYSSSSSFSADFLEFSFV